MQSFLSMQCRPEFLALFLLSCTTSIFSVLRYDLLPAHTESNSPIAGLGNGLRRALSRYFYIRADQYAHADPKGTRYLRKDDQIIRRSTFRLSKEMIPPLRLSVMLDPQFVDAMALLGSHIGVDMKLDLAGLRLLQRSISQNPGHPKSFWLYGAIGRIYFETEQWARASRYFEAAVKTYPLMMDSALLEKYATTHEIRDQNYARNNITMWMGAAFRARDFEAADRAMALIPDLNFVDSPIAQFLASWRSDPTVAANFDPIAYLAANSTVAPADTETGTEHEHPHEDETETPFEGRIILEIDLERPMQIKLLVLGILPLLALGSLLVRGRRR